MRPWRTMCRTEDLRAADLWLEKENKYGEVAVEIADVRAEEAQGDNGKKTIRPFVYFARHPIVNKPLKLNSTNGMTIESLLGTAIAEEWRGARITLYVTKVRAPKGGMVDAIRVAQKLPEQAPRKGAPSADEQRAIAERERQEVGRG